MPSEPLNPHRPPRGAINFRALALGIALLTIALILLELLHRNVTLGLALQPLTSAPVIAGLLSFGLATAILSVQSSGLANFGIAVGTFAGITGGFALGGDYVAHNEETSRARLTSSMVHAVHEAGAPGSWAGIITAATHGVDVSQTERFLWLFMHTPPTITRDGRTAVITLALPPASPPTTDESASLADITKDAEAPASCQDILLAWHAYLATNYAPWEVPPVLAAIRVDGKQVASTQTDDPVAVAWCGHSVSWRFPLVAGAR